LFDDHPQQPADVGNPTHLQGSITALLSKTHRKQAPLNIYLRELAIQIHLTSQAFKRVAGILQERLIIEQHQN
jgi:hypothetical protein